MPRTLAAFVLVSALVAPIWLSLEEDGFPLGGVASMVALAFLPTLAVHLRRRPAVIAATLVLATLGAGGAAFDLAITDARRGDRDFFGPLLSSFKQGLLEFYDTRVPFDPERFPLMHGVVLLAVFASVAVAGMAIAARRLFAALGAVIVGAGVPATMASTWVEASRPLTTGALILVAALTLVLLLRGVTRGLAHAGAAALAIVAVAVAGSASEAVAKRGFVDWDSWDFYDRPDDPVDVRYVWDSNYEGISFPKKRTTVLRVDVDGPRRSLYWRATTLDTYTGTAWREELTLADALDGSGSLDAREVDELLPDAARDESEWVRQEVTIEALNDVRLLGSAQAVRWELDAERFARVATNGTVTLDRPLARGERYTVWSYVRRPRIRDLRAAGTDYPDAAYRYLRASGSPDDAPLFPWGAQDRDEFMDAYFAERAIGLAPGHRDIWATAREVTAGARSPYEAAVLLEAWFRGSEGGFTYDESPPPREGEPPLVAFLGTKRGYCQQYAGAMALMLRYLGIPARVAAGFTSGTYDEQDDQWVVTDHNAHTWVEVYFPGHGWVEFDPTPNRGQLSVNYSPFSSGFDASEAARLGGAIERIPEVREQLSRAEEAGGVAGAAQRSGGDGGGGVPEAVVDTGRGVLALVLVVLGGAAALIVTIKEARRRLRFATRDPRGAAAACRRDLVAYLADQGIAVPPSATLPEVGVLVEQYFAANPAPFVAAATEARFGSPSAAAGRIGAARAELRRLRRRMSGRLSLAQRVRGALSLRSLAA
ncbi:MAG TPA: transglutaminaseTgpA domain-containing protein [Gaiellaceae bacterium]|nr:transglutaminaseTgpA domain-containing protein [Gaiellaceae bacterium]